MSVTGDGGPIQVSQSIEVGIRTDDIIVVGWIDPLGVPELDPDAVLSDVLSAMPINGKQGTASLNCNLIMGALSYNAVFDPLSLSLPNYTIGDSTYILHWLFLYSGNADAPQTEPDFSFRRPGGIAADPQLVATFVNTPTNYKLFNRFQLKMRITTDPGTGLPVFNGDPMEVVPSVTAIGTTVNPCGGILGTNYLSLVPGQPGPVNGSSTYLIFPTRSSMVNDGSPDADAVAAFNTLAGIGQSPVFWENIGSRITFTAANPLSPTIVLQSYPSYNIYVNGALYQSVPEASDPIRQFQTNPYPFGTVPCVAVFPLPGGGFVTSTTPGGQCGVEAPPDVSARTPLFIVQ